MDVGWGHLTKLDTVQEVERATSSLFEGGQIRSTGVLIFRLGTNLLPRQIPARSLKASTILTSSPVKYDACSANTLHCSPGYFGTSPAEFPNARTPERQLTGLRMSHMTDD